MCQVSPGANTWPVPGVEVRMKGMVGRERGAWVGRVFAALFVVAGLAAVASAQEATPSVVDGTFESMRGGERTLSSERGRRIVVVFYEDRNHIDDNTTFKGDLQRFVVDNHLDDRVVVYGVANLGDVGAVPHAIVRSMISPLLDRWGTDILLDWEGTMRAAPFSFPTDATTCAIIDRTGAIIYRHTGLIDDTERRAFYRSLRGAIAR